MREESENSSKVSFYLLPRAGREPSPPSPDHLQHRLSIIKEVSEESSAASTPQSSPSRNPPKQIINVVQKISDQNVHRKGPKESFNKSFPSYSAESFSPHWSPVPGDIKKLAHHQEIVIHTSGRGEGVQNKSSQR